MLDWVKCVVEILVCGYQCVEVCVCAASGKHECKLFSQLTVGEENAKTRASMYR